MCDTVTVTQEHNMLGQSPDEIAKFLAKTTGLNKTMVGEYLGEREDMCLKVMHAYVDAMNFADLQFDEAIRYTCCILYSLYLLAPTQDRVKRWLMMTRLQIWKLHFGSLCSVTSSSTLCPQSQ